MKIWAGYGSEHSTNLKMIGHFRDEEAARAAAEIFERLGKRVEEDMAGDTYDPGGDSPEFTDAMAALLRELEVYSLRPADVENFAYDHRVEREGLDLVLTTDEDTIGGFLKLLLDADARVEIFSMHTHTPEGTRQDEER